MIDTYTLRGRSLHFSSFVHSIFGKFNVLKYFLSAQKKYIEAAREVISTENIPEIRNIHI